ncbi:MAG: hypothetical protein GY950_05215 [bacterium]|nr:hypothetical protein [bacterium]
MKNKKTIYLALILILLTTPFVIEAGKKKAKGIVFEDSNNNGIFDKGEKGIPGIAVSNQYDVVQTDKKGRFRLKVDKENIIFVSKPAGYNPPLDKNNLPKFYYIHQPKGSPEGLKYKGIEPTGKLPRSINFPLVKGKAEDTFSVIVMGDPQTRTAEEVNYYRDDIVAGLLDTKARFYLGLGDIMYDHLDLYDKMLSVVKQIGIPIHHVMGNHDMNYRVPDNKYEAETFKRVHGPDYYSFNHGGVHFVVLNSVKYKGWNKEKNKPGRYMGFIHERQLTWLKNDLSVVPADHLVVLTMHIPVLSRLYDQNDANCIVNREAVFKVLENRKHLLALAGHMHFMEYIEFTEKEGWHGKAVFPSLTAGAGCGTWWHGPKVPGGLPYGMATDGAPNGYFLFTFKGTDYNYDFYPSRSSGQGQMRINSPGGTLSLEGLQEEPVNINVNVFTGTPRTMVSYQLGGGPEMRMERKVMKDPFFAKLIEVNRDSYIDWMEPVLSSHIWTAPLPDGLEPGIHRLKVTAKDHQGNIFTAYRLFEVTH